MMLALLLCMVFLIGMGNGCDYALAQTDDQEPEGVYAEMDGTKIEGLLLRWLTEDSTTMCNGFDTPQVELDDKAHLYLTAADAGSMTYRIEFQLSGQHDYAPGDLTITIPEQIWHGRRYDVESDGTLTGVVDENVLLGSLELPVPAAPAKTADFNWQRIDGQIVLTNTTTIGAASSVSIEVAIRNISPVDIVDMSTSDPITATVVVVTNEGNLLTATSTPITAQIDTIAEINGVVKGGVLLDDYTSVPASLLNNPQLTEDPSQYVYVRWYSYYSRSNSQPYTLRVKDKPLNVYTDKGELQPAVEGIFLGSEEYNFVTNADGSYYKDEEGFYLATGGVTATENGGIRNDYANTLYAYTAYLKEDIPGTAAVGAQVTYYLPNSIEWELVEVDAPVADADRGKDEDERKESKKDAATTVTYTPAVWDVPPGHFKVFKWTESKGLHDYNYGYALNRLQSGREVDMNFVLQTIGYGYPWTTPYTGTLDADYEDFTKGNYGQIAGSKEEIMDSMGTLGWTQTTYDYATFFDEGMLDPETELTSRDFEIQSMRVTEPSKMRFGEKASGYAYMADSALPTPDLKIEYRLSDEEGAPWHNAATAVWGEDGTGELTFKDVNTAAGVSVSGSTVYFPKNTVETRHTFTSNVFNGVQMEGQCELAAIDWLVYPTITLKPSKEVLAQVAALYEETQNDSPSTKFENDVDMFVYGWVEQPDEGVLVLAEDKEASYATLSSAGYGVSLTKSASFDSRPDYLGGDNSTAQQQMTLHYSAQLTVRSNLRNRSEYDEAVSQGVIPAQTSGVWYDLLPVGVKPKLDTVRLRSGDTISNLYTINNYRQSGRTLLVAEVNLQPMPINSGGAYADCPSISFEAIYSWEELDKVLTGTQRATTLQNYIAFESTVDELPGGVLGTIKTQQGEADAPTRAYNTTTPFLPEDIKALMTNLDPNTDEQRFVYASAPVTVSKLNYAVSGLKKMVQNDLNRVWTQGLDEQEQVTVYEGHDYTYRLKVTSAAKTYTGNIILYDSIENYIVPAPDGSEMDATKTADYQHVQDRKDWYGQWYGKGQWRGTLNAVDMSEFFAMDVAPQLYYATEPGLQFADSVSDSYDDNFDEDTGLFNTGYYDLTNREGNVWTAVDEADLVNGVWTVPEGLGVTAIAIDAGKKADGTAFYLKPDETTTAYLHMTAPDDHGDPNLWNAKGAYARTVDADGNAVIDWEAALDPANNMYAYNNTRMKCTQSFNPGDSTTFRMVRNDYTRVGIVPCVVNVEKIWDDDNDHDGIRPSSIEVTLMRRTAGIAGDPQPVLGGNGWPLRAELNEENGWRASFAQVDAVNDSGLPYLYSFDEGDIDGYTSSLTWVDDSHYQLTNTHPKEQLRIHGQKVWNDQDDLNGARPETITLRLLRAVPAAEGEDLAWVELDSREVDQGTNGDWTFDFGSYDRYAPGGVQYLYRIEEDYVPKYQHVIVSQIVEPLPPAEGEEQALAEHSTVVTNTYDPRGNLMISKTVVGATENSVGKAFTFTLVLLEEEADADGNAVPLMNQYEAVKLENGVEIEGSETTVTSGSTFTLTANQQLLICDLPSEATYAVTEAAMPGFTATAVDDEGTIRAGETVEAAFTNTYAASGSVSLALSKELKGHAIAKNQFHFEIVDVTDGQELVVQEGSVSAPENDPQGGLGEEILSAAKVLFGDLSFSAEDHGKTFTYEVREKDEGKPGYTYDKLFYTVTVTPTDNGDGTMSVDVSIVNSLTGETSNNLTGFMKLENHYDATGSLNLKAWKALTGRDLAAGEFFFQLYQVVDGTAVSMGADYLATNDADGNVVFAALTFDQNDVSTDKENPAHYTYLVREVQGTDPDVIYSTQEYYYEVDVIDNGDGKLSFNQTACVKTEDGSMETAVPVFTNTLKPGGLSITKYVEDDEDDEDAEDQQGAKFTFEVRLTGDNLPETLKYTITNADGTTTDGDTTVDGGGEGSGGSDETGGGNTEGGSDGDGEDGETGGETGGDSTDDTVQVYHLNLDEAEWRPFVIIDQVTKEAVLIRTPVDEDGTYHYTYERKIKDSEGTVTSTQTIPLEINLNQFVKASDNYSKKVRSTHYNSAYSLILYDLSYTESSTESNTWLITSADRELFTAFRMEGGWKPKGVFQLFYSNQNIQTVELDKLDTSAVTGFYSAFDNCTSLKSIDVSVWDTSNVTSLSNMFDRCYNLTKVTGIGNWNTSKVTSCYSMFVDAWHLTKAEVFQWTDLKSLSGSGLTCMFRNCRALGNLGNNNVCQWETGTLTSLERMFSACNRLPGTLDLSCLETGNVINFSNMFYDCETLKEIKVNGWDTSSGTTFQSMFQNCDNLTRLDLSSFTISQVTSLNNFKDMLDFGDYSDEPQHLLLGDGFSNTNAYYVIKYATGSMPFETITLTDNTKVNTDDYQISDNYYTGNWLQLLDANGNPPANEVILEESRMLRENGHGGTWTWEPNEYTLNLKGGEGGGEKTFENVKATEAYTITLGEDFSRPGYAIDYFQEGSGWQQHQFWVQDGKITIPARTYGSNSEENFNITLTAHWYATEGEVAPENGVFKIELYAGQKATIKDQLPAGVSYTITEQALLDWEQVSASNDSGVIQPQITSDAFFTNRYNPGADREDPLISVKKKLIGRPLKDNMFTFELLDITDVSDPASLTPEELIAQAKWTDTTTNIGDVVSFDNVYTYVYNKVDSIEGGWLSFVFLLREAKADNPDYQYDETIYVVCVEGYKDYIRWSVTIHGATYYAYDEYFREIVSDEDYPMCLEEAPTFVNTAAPETGTLIIEKAVTGELPQAAMGKTFGVQLTFTKNHLPWTGEIYQVVDDVKTKLNVVDGQIEGTDGVVQVKIDQPITYLVPLNVRYIAQETEPDTPGWTMDRAEYTGLIAENETSKVTITNAYAASATTARLEVIKQLEGRVLQANDFAFQLTGEIGAPMPDVTKAWNDVNGKVVFGPITFDTVGTYRYILAEVCPTDADTEPVSPANGKVQATVTVSDAGDGRLRADVTYDDDNNTIVNRVIPAQDASLSLSKTVSGMETDQYFTFSISLVNQYGQSLSGTYPVSGASSSQQLTVVNGRGMLQLRHGETAVITQLPSGCTYNITETEVQGFDSVGTGDVTGTIKPDMNAAAVFTNTYKPWGQAVFKASKQLTGATLAKDQFTFALYEGAYTDAIPADVDPIQTVTNTASGAVAFRPIEYTLADVGTHTYTICEVAGNEDGYLYDETLHTVTVTVTDASGSLHVQTAYQGGAEPVFHNTYNAKVSFPLTAVKTVSGAVPANGQTFAFTLCNAQGDVLQTAHSDADGRIVFTPIEYGLNDIGQTYTYTVQEVPGDAVDIQYDETVYTASATITKDEQGVLEVTVSVKDSEGNDVSLPMPFDNTQLYFGGLEISKTVQGNAADPQESFAFTVVLKDGEGQELTDAFECTINGVTTSVTSGGTLMLKHGQKAVVSNLPAGTVYTVTETDAKSYTATSTGSTGVIENNQTAQAAFINTRDVFTDLTISKTVVGGSLEEPFEFTVTLLDANDQPLTQAFTCVGDYTGSIVSGESITLKHDQSVTIQGLPFGTKYRVVETPDPRYQLSIFIDGAPAAPASGVMEEDNVKLEFQNMLLTTTFAVTKVWDGLELGSISLTLYANGEKMDPQPFYDREGDVYKYTDLPMYTKEGDWIVYSAKEKVPEGYLVIYDNIAPYEDVTKFIHDGGTIINREVMDISVRKVWSGVSPEDAPEITLTLYCNGEVVNRKAKKLSDGWYRFSNLPVRADGAYYVVEEPMSGCITTYQNTGVYADVTDRVYNGGTITNTVIPKTGDNQNPLAYALLLAGSTMGMIVLHNTKKRRTGNN